MPISKNGLLGFYNIVPACSSCNGDKGADNVINYILTSNHDVKKLTKRWIKAIDYMIPRAESALRARNHNKFSLVDWCKML